MANVHLDVAKLILIRNYNASKTVIFWADELWLQAPLQQSSSWPRMFMRKGQAGNWLVMFELAKGTRIFSCEISNPFN